METFTPKGKIHGPIMPQFILEMSITHGAKIMYALLCNYASEKDHCWPSQATLAGKLSCSVSSVKNYLSELVNAQLVVVRREQYRSSIYYLLRPNVKIREPKVIASESTFENVEPKIIASESTFENVEPKVDSLNTLNKETKNKTHSPLPPKNRQRSMASPSLESRFVGGASDSDFETVWSSYPKKEAKGLARYAWLQLRQNGLLPPLNDLLTCLKRFMSAENWQRDQGRYIPQLSNWLRGERWLDFSIIDADQEAQRKERNANLQAYHQKEDAEAAKRKIEREKLRPVFNAFADRFRAIGEHIHEPMAFGSWMFMHSNGCAPLASDVQDGNTLEIMRFLKDFRRKHEEAEYQKRKSENSIMARITETLGCDDLLQQGFFSQLFAEREQTAV